MFQKNSFSIPSDSSGILLTKIIQTRRCNTRRHATVCRFLLVVVRKTTTILNKIKKKKSRAIVIRTKYIKYLKYGKYYNFYDNALVLLKKRMNARGKELFGPTSKEMKIKKFRIAYKCVF